MKKRLAVYCGSFNPLHRGHLDILLKAEKLFDEVVIAVGENSEKNSDNRINRVETIKLQVPDRKVEGYSGFLIDFVYKKEEEGYDVTVVRGFRNGSDLDSEINMLRVLEDQKPNIKVVYLPCGREFEYISSSMIRSLEHTKPGAGSEYIAKPEMLEKKI